MCHDCGLVRFVALRGMSQLCVVRVLVQPSCKVLVVVLRAMSC
jgi:hypothetical protein